jgi:SAM-dependent methyltransferase
MQHESPKETEPTGKSLLLSSFAEFWSLIEPLLLAVRPRRVCEVGVGQGEFTALLIEFCKKNACRYVGIDSRVKGLDVLQSNAASAEFLHGSSLSVLPTLAPQDVYFIDGDHNYFTVSNELKLILQRPDRWPLVILHDVGWPWGRRDQYCSPESISEAFRHAHSAKLGAAPGRHELGFDGFSGETSAYSYSASLHEGGLRNGVLTAVEDFIREQPGGEWRVVIVPVVFGLAVLYAPAHGSPELRELMEQLTGAVTPLRPLLELLERNRIDLVLTHLRGVKDSAAIHADYKALAEHELKLRAEYDRLLEHANALQKAYDALKAAAGLRK